MTTPLTGEVYIDGACSGNPGPAGVGIVFMDDESRPGRQLSKYLGEATNNIAEYLALIYALYEALREGYASLTVKTDSELLARQFNGRYVVRDPKLRLLYDLARHFATGFARCSVEHIPRTRNAAADKLARQAVQGGMKSFTREPSDAD